MLRRRLPSVVALTAITVLLSAMLVSAANARPAGRAPTRAVPVVKGIVSHWSPTTVRITAGGRVKWKAVSGTHTVTAYGHWTFNHSLAQGTSVTHRFTGTGTFKFRCTIHSSLVNGVCSGMCGKVVVS